MNFDFGCAKALYGQGRHPRVLMSEQEISELRPAVRSGCGQKVMQALRQKLRPLFEILGNCDDVAALLMESKVGSPDPGARLVGNLHEMSLVALLDEDAGAIKGMRRLLVANCVRELAQDSAAGTGPAPAKETAKGRRIPSLGGSALAYDLLYQHISEPERESCREALKRDIEARLENSDLGYYRRAGHNITLITTLSAIWDLLAIKGDPGAPELEAEQAKLLSMLDATMHVVFGPDGYPEEDMGYGTFVAGWMSQLVEALRRAGIYDPYKVCPCYASFGRAILHFVQPWGEHLSNTGDHGDDFGQREFVLARLAQETDDPTLMWLLGTLSYGGPDAEVKLRPGFQVPTSTLSLITLPEALEPVHPSRRTVPTQFRDRGRGIVSFRSGWRDDDTFVVFDGSQRSPAAQGHFHASCGHFSLSALGEYFAIDTGRYNIEQNCHNVVLVDGKSGRSTNGEWDYTKYHGLLMDYLPGDFVDFAAVDSSHQHDCYWARRCLGLVKGRGATSAYVWTVEDINKANDLREYWWQLHTSPENTIKTNTNSASVKGCRKGNWLDVHWVLPEPHEYPEPHRLQEVTQDEATPSSYKYIPDPHKRAQEAPRPAAMVHYSVFVRPRLIAKVSGLNGRFMSLMLPRLRGEKPARIKRLDSVPNSLAVRISFPDVEDTLIFAYEHNLLEAGDVKGRGQWCVVRRSRKTGRVLDYALGHGTALSTDGRPLRV